MQVLYPQQQQAGASRWKRHSHAQKLRNNKAQERQSRLNQLSHLSAIPAFKFSLSTLLYHKVISLCYERNRKKKPLQRGADFPLQQPSGSRWNVHFLFHKKFSDLGKTILWQDFPFPLPRQEIPLTEFISCSRNLAILTVSKSKDQLTRTTGCGLNRALPRLVGEQYQFTIEGYHPSTTTR